VFTAIGLDTCPEPQTPTYGIRVGDRYMVGDVVMFQCEQGYSLQVILFCALITSLQIVFHSNIDSWEHSAVFVIQKC